MLFILKLFKKFLNKKNKKYKKPTVNNYVQRMHDRFVMAAILSDEDTFERLDKIEKNPDGTHTYYLKNKNKKSPHKNKKDSKNKKNSNKACTDALNKGYVDRVVEFNCVDYFAGFKY